MGDWYFAPAWPGHNDAECVTDGDGGILPHSAVRELIAREKSERVRARLERTLPACEAPYHGNWDLLPEGIPGPQCNECWQRAASHVEDMDD